MQKYQELSNDKLFKNEEILWLLTLQPEDHPETEKNSLKSLFNFIISYEEARKKYSEEQLFEIQGWSEMVDLTIQRFSSVALEIRQQSAPWYWPMLVACSYISEYKLLL